MLRCLVGVCLMSGALDAQLAVPPPTLRPEDDKVVAVLEGKEYKISDLEKLARALPSQMSTNFYRDKKAFLEQLTMLMAVAHLAEQKKLDKDFPHAERLAYNRDVYLYTAMIQVKDLEIPVMPDEQKKYYEERKSEFGEAKVRVIYLAFNNTPMDGDGKTKKPLTEVEAGQKAASLVKQLRAGGDFAALAKQNSDDETSRDKGGEFPTIKPKDNAVPPAIKTAVFALKQGEVSDPIKQANGFYIFKLEEMVLPPYEQVRDDIYKNIKSERLTEWLDSVKKGLKIEYKDEQYLSEKAPRQ